MVLSGQAQYGRQIVTVSNGEGKIVAYAKPRYPAVRSFSLALLFYFKLLHLFWGTQLINIFEQIKGSDTSTTESGSEVEDVTSPNLSRSYTTHARLTPVREEVC